MTVFSSCQDGKNRSIDRSIVRINLGEDAKTLDPRKSRTLSEKNLMILFFEGLTEIGASGLPELALAEEIVGSEDGKVYTIRLRKALWSNGDPITAEDYVRTWKSTLSPSFPSPNAYQLFCLKNGKAIKEGTLPPDTLGVTALDSETLRIETEVPLPYFQELLSFPVFFPLHETFEESCDRFVFSGPFVIKNRKREDRIEAERNPLYYDRDSVRISGLRITSVDQETEIRMFEAGELDWAGSPFSTLSSEDIVSFRDKKILRSFPMAGTKFFRVNVEAFPFTDPDIRKAFALSVQRNELIRHVLQGEQAPALQFVPGSDRNFFSDADTGEALRHWERGLLQSGLTKDTFPTVRILCVNAVQNLRVVQAIAKDWERNFSIKVEIDPREIKVFYHLLDTGEYQIALGSWIGDYTDPESFLELFRYKDTPSNNTGWENVAYGIGLKEAERLSGAERKNRLLSCESILLGDFPVIPLYHLAFHYVRNPSLSGVVLLPSGTINFKHAVFTKEDKNGI